MIARTIAVATTRFLRPDSLAPLASLVFAVQVMPNPPGQPVWSIFASKLRQLFKPVEETCDNVEKIVKEKIKVYLDNKNADIDITEDTRSLTEKLEGTGELPKSIRKRTVTKIRVIDEELLPRTYLMPNDKKITEDFKNGIEIPGTEVYTDTIIESR